MNQPFDPYHQWLGISPKDQPPNHYRLLGIDVFDLQFDMQTAGPTRPDKWQRVSTRLEVQSSAHSLPCCRLTGRPMTGQPQTSPRLGSSRSAATSAM